MKNSKQQSACANLRPLQSVGGRPPRIAGVKLVRLSISIQPKHKAALAAIAYEQRISISQAIEKLVDGVLPGENTSDAARSMVEHFRRTNPSAFRFEQARDTQRSSEESTELGLPAASESDHWKQLAAAMYQAAGAYDMPVRFLDALSSAANGEPFVHLIDSLLPCESPANEAGGVPWPEVVASVVDNDGKVKSATVAMDGVLTSMSANEATGEKAVEMAEIWGSAPPAQPKPLGPAGEDDGDMLTIAYMSGRCDERKYQEARASLTKPATVAQGDERRAFEAWYRPRFMDPASSRIQMNKGSYASHQTQAAWEAWLERARLARGSKSGGDVC